MSLRIIFPVAHICSLRNSIENNGQRFNGHRWRWLGFIASCQYITVLYYDSFLVKFHLLLFVLCVCLIKLLLQFVNKLRYAREGARDIMDRTCADLPWQVWLEVDGKDIEIPRVYTLQNLEIKLLLAFMFLIPNRSPYL